MPLEQVIPFGGDAGRVPVIDITSKVSYMKWIGALPDLQRFIWWYDSRQTVLNTTRDTEQSWKAAHRRALTDMRYSFEKEGVELVWTEEWNLSESPNPVQPSWPSWRKFEYWV